MNANVAAKISSFGDLGPVKVAHDVGGLAAGGDIESTMGRVAGVTVGGSFFGKIASNENLGLVKIGGDARGVLAANPGRITSGADIAGVTIGGSLVGGENGMIFNADAGEIRTILDRSDS